MNAIRASELIKKYEACQACGNLYVGAGEGTLIVQETLKRNCKCGWSIEVNENDEPV